MPVKPDDIFARIAQAQAEAEKRRAAHRTKRVSLGLCPEAGTGDPEPAILLDGEKEAPNSFFEGMPAEDRAAIDAANAFAAGRSLNEPIAEFIEGTAPATDAIERHEARRDRAVLDRQPIGASRLGGLPDLPRTVPWPILKGKKIPFLAQINLGDLPPTKHLPPDGWLYAFGLSTSDPAFDHDPVAVGIHRGPASKLVRQPYPADDEIWPDSGNKRVYETVPVAARPPGKKTRKKGEHGRLESAWLFGEMWDVYGTPGKIADYRMQDGTDWINLLAIKSVGSMQWSDVGHLYLLIRRRDLANGDFTKVISAVCSS